MPLDKQLEVINTLSLQWVAGMHSQVEPIDGGSGPMQRFNLVIFLQLGWGSVELPR